MPYSMSNSMTKSEKLYDAAMRLPYVAYQLYFLVRELSGLRMLVGSHPYFGGDWSFVMMVAARVSIIVFITVLLSFYVSRFRPISKYSNWSPKITALLGTLFMYLLLLTPRAPVDAFWDSLSTVLILVGCVTSILVVVDLGRSLSIMPEARKLVTSGLYGRIRHPLYFAEEIAILGFYLQFRSWQTLPILVIHFYFQIRRMDWEESILAKAFPEYAGYKQRTFRLLPGLY
jgi:protein-S-isoprenylcysteine O-methyltransferase Ste14